jgi:hypothetical protein
MVSGYRNRSVSSMKVMPIADAWIRDRETAEARLDCAFTWKRHGLMLRYQPNSISLSSTTSCPSMKIATPAKFRRLRPSP